MSQQTGLFVSENDDFVEYSRHQAACRTDRSSLHRAAIQSAIPCADRVRSDAWKHAERAERRGLAYGYREGVPAGFAAEPHEHEGIR